MMELWRKRGWNEGEQHTDFRAEVFKWLKLLLSVVKLTDPDAPLLFKKFFGQKRHSIVTDTEFCQSVFDQVLEDTRRNFSILSIRQFCNLYKLFRVWPLNVSDSLFQHFFLKKKQIRHLLFSAYINNCCSFTCSC